MPLNVKFVGKGSSTPVKVPVPEEDPAKKAAISAVEKFEAEYQVLREMREDFANSFPDAHNAMQEILRQEDLVRDCIKHAHALVQEAKETIGPFSCTRKWSKPCYDDAEFTKIIKELEGNGQLLEDLLAAGVIETIVLSKNATAFFAQNPELEKFASPAWKEKAEKTAAVTDPKI